MALRMVGTLPEATVGLGKGPTPSGWAGCLAALPLARFAGSS